MGNVFSPLFFFSLQQEASIACTKHPPSEETPVQVPCFSHKAFWWRWRVGDSRGSGKGLGEKASGALPQNSRVRKHLTTGGPWWVLLAEGYLAWHCLSCRWTEQEFPSYPKGGLKLWVVLREYNQPVFLNYHSGLTLKIVQGAGLAEERWSLRDCRSSPGRGWWWLERL